MLCESQKFLCDLIFQRKHFHAGFSLKALICWRVRVDQLQMWTCAFRYVCLSRHFRNGGVR